MVSRKFRWFIFFTLASLLLFTRIFALNDKPYHHDEGIYATLSYRLAQNFNYQFDPITHGPLLFFAEAALFKILPINDASGRLPSALAGIALVILGWILLRHRPEKERILWGTMVILSPVLAYFSRFLGMDLPMAALATGFLAFASLWNEHRRNRDLYVCAAILGGMICLKLNWLFYAFSFATFLLVSRRMHVLRSISKRSWVIGLSIIVIMFCLLYSTLGKNPMGIWDGLFGKMIPYWVHQNRVQRIAGPFHYYLVLLGIYELPLVIGFAIALAKGARSFSNRKIWVLGLSITAALWVLGYFFFRASPFLRHYFHMDAYFHPALLALIVTVWIAQLRDHLQKGESFEAFLAHWMWTSLLLYSYAGEKIPWLTVHIVLPATFYFASVLRRVEGRPFWIVMIAVLSFQTVNVTRAIFLDAADPKERLVYTHTTYDVSRLIRRIRAIQHDGRQLKIQMFSTCQGVWPFSWYLRGQRNWFRATLNPREHPHLVFSDWTQKDVLLEQFGPQYVARRLPLRAWWVPDPNEYSLKNFARYFLTHENFNPTGSTDLVVLIREDTLSEIDVSN